MTGIVYAIVNTANDRRYVGCTDSKTGRARFLEHLSQLRRGIHCNPRLQADADRDGLDVLALEILETGIPDDLSGPGLCNRERWWIARYRQEPGGVYNRDARKPIRYVTTLGVEPAALVGDGS